MAVAQATALLDSSFAITVKEAAGGHGFTAAPDTLRRWLSFRLQPLADGRAQLIVQIDEEQVGAFAQRIAEEVNTPAIDAQLDFDPKTNQVIVLRPSQPGQRLDTAAAVATIEAALSAALPQAEASAANRAMTAPGEIMLPVTLVAPRVDSTRIAEMGIVVQISEGTTYFKGSSPERVHNIVLSADKLRGAVIPPGDSVSASPPVRDRTPLRTVRRPLEPQCMHVRAV